jgi:paraquat-inducible protein B
MAKRPSPQRVGAFILGGLILVVVAIAVWGSGKLFERRYRFLCYFPGSVNGLNIGAPVKYRGVAIGSVVDMRVRYEQSVEDTRIPVFIELYGKRMKELGVMDAPEPELIERLIQRGLRARLESQSLVTGQLYVNLDLYPDTPATRTHPHGRYPEIPTIPTTMEEATRSLTALLRQLKDADVAGTARSLASAVDGINRLVNTPAIGATLSELPSTVASVRQLARNADSEIKRTLTELQTTLAELREGLGGVKALTAARGPMVLELQRTLMEVQKAADAVRTLADFLQRNPNALIVGKKRP